MKLIVMILFLVILTTVKAGNWKREFIGRCEYINYNNTLLHAGDCNYHLRLDENRHEDIISELKKISSKLK